jgi:Carboxypeptidase regulatory-like domain
MRLITLVTIYLVLSATATPSDSATLRGMVTDAEGAPIPNPYVLVHRSVGGITDVRAQVQHDGSFFVSVSPGFYDVFVTAIGFSPRCTKMEMRMGRSEVYNPRLEISKIESSESAQEQ